MNSREQFEAAYAEDNNVPVEFVALCRQGDSYNVPKVARAWYWWKRSRAAVVVELPEKYPEHAGTWSDMGDANASGRNDAISECQAAIEAAGLKVAP